MHVNDRMLLSCTHDYMQDNAFGDEGVQELARALEHNTCITHLDVGVCCEAGMIEYMAGRRP